MQILNASDHFRTGRVKKTGERQASRIIEGIRFTLLGTTMMPQFTHHAFAGGDREELIPDEVELIRRLTRPDKPLHMTS